MVPKRRLTQSVKPETLSEIDLPDGRIAGQCKRRARTENLSPVNYICAVDDAERLAHVVIGDQYADPGGGESPDDLLDVDDRDRVDAGERLVQQQEEGREDEAPRDLHSAPLSPRQSVRPVTPERAQPELGEQRVAAVATGGGREVERLEDREEVLLDGHSPEDRGLLRQVRDAGARAQVHRHLRD